MNYIFPLKKNITIPSPTVPNAYLVFPFTTCALTYSILPKPQQSTMSVELIIADKVSGKHLFTLTQFAITEAGFPTGVVLNQADIDAYNTAKTTLATEILSLNEQLMAKDLEAQVFISQSLPVPEELTLEIENLQTQLVTKNAELVALGSAPAPITEVRNKYSDVIQYFDNTGSITTEGIVWAKTIPFGGATLGDYLV